ncbi:MAG TPA: DNA-processing protein DprA [Xylanibacter oryzae]|uniref:DNA-processing protein DprA n=1 Tax=Xylanibacter oryzae TaxID=185293 RepID=UPI0004BCC9DB|nr:DNA-processing protein DprA [Xylanibacter oryzae]MBP7358327.1 DNA-processing protein DprA [Prevotella sp.]HRN16276.1 DNA-processing protein DprA [Xylanibacter oryzae]
MNDQETLYTLALTRIGFFSIAGALQLYRQLGDATTIYDHRNDIQDILPDCSPHFLKSIKDWDEPLKRAEVEMEYDLAHNIRILCLNDDNYPQRMKECDDAPLVLFYTGTANLNQSRIINIVGTRMCTVQGQDIIRKFVADLKSICPKVLIVSGLAYGVDIHAHRNALLSGYETVGVLAHGLDNLYPSRHKETANKMVRQGGLLTEFFTNTNADKVNFVRRNRIVAGMSDACILVESAAKGGGLITAGIAQSYDRDVFAFPGRPSDPYSEGCNNLIRDSGAGLINNAIDFVRAMHWEDDATLIKAQNAGIERSLFPNLSAEEQSIVKLLQKTNDLQINMLTVHTNMPINKVTALLFQLEIKGVVKTLAGGTYHLMS